MMGEAEAADPRWYWQNQRGTHYTFPLGRYLVKQGIPDLYLVGSREIQIIVYTNVEW